jgi:hypothetical protein
MKIAICLSGQLRTWKTCIESWYKLTDRLKSEYGVEVDYFAHLWDYDTIPNSQLLKPEENFNPNGDYITVNGIKISEEDKNDFVNILKPKYYLFENESINKKKPIECIEENKKISHFYGNSLLHWSSPQFYSVMRSTFFKKKYELENNFRYDICFRMRCDLYFSDDELNVFFNKELNSIIPKHNTIYSCHTHEMKLGDIFFYSNSVTFDRICDFYKWLPIMGTKSFPTKSQNLTTEDAFYFYSRMLKINVKPILVNPKIIRNENN